MQILGGNWDDCEAVEKAYVRHSQVKIVPTFKTDIVSASLLKYTINSWLATKVTFMNELYQLHKSSGARTSWEQFTDMLQRDKRIGDSHLRVPGIDGKFGFGGHCFPKDTKGLLNYAKQQNIELKVLAEAVEVNEYHRKQI
jgi:UDPglucose 6-dehydrogenase